MKRFVLAVVVVILAVQLSPMLSLVTNNPPELKAGEVIKFRWGNVSMIEVTADLIFKVVNTTQYQFYIPNSWSIDTALTSTGNKLYRIYYIPINPFNPNPNELVITFKYDIYVAPPANSTPYDFATRVIINSPEEEDMPQAMKEVADQLFKTAETYYEVIYRATDFTSDYLTYDLNYVTKEMSVSQIWDARRGVCRHYAKFEKALLNYAGVRALYADGFLIYEDNGKKEVIPHAWLLVYDPVNGWFPVDPTNHNFNHDNSFVTGVVYPFDLLVYAGAKYETSVDYPIKGQLTFNNVETSFKIVSVKPIAHLKVYEYRLPNGFSFLYTEGAGLLIYHPLNQVFTDNSPMSNYNLVAKYESSIVEYVPSGYLVPIGFEPYTSRVFLNYYYDVQPIVIKLNASVYVKGNTIVFSGFPHKIYLTDVNDEYTPMVEEDGNQLWPISKGFTKVVDGKYYVPIFGVWYYLPMSISNVKSVNVTPVAVYGDNGLNYVVLKIDTDPSYGKSILNFVVSNYNPVKILTNDTFLFSGSGDEMTIKVADRSYKFNVQDLENTAVRIKSLRVSVTASTTTFNLTVENLSYYLSLGLNLPGTAIINGQQVSIYNVRHDNDWVSFQLPTTVGLLTNNFTITYLSTFKLGHSLLDPEFRVASEKLTFVNVNSVKLTVELNTTTWVNITAEAIDKLFPNGILTVEGNGREHLVTVSTLVPATLLKTSFSTVVSVLGQSIPVNVVIDNYNTLRVAGVRVNKYSYTNTTVQLTMTETFTSGEGVADTGTLVLLKTKLNPYALINGVPIPYSDYYQTGSSLVFTVNVPVSVLKKSDSIIVDGVRLSGTYTVRVVQDYTNPGLLVKGLAPLGGLNCSAPYTIAPGDKPGEFMIKLDVHTVGKTVVCHFGGKTYRITPQYTGIVSFTFVDTTRIDDVTQNGMGVYAGYDGVVISVTTTQPPAFGEYKLVVDNKTLASGRLTTLKATLPELGVGEHTIKLYDGNFLVWEATFRVYPQPFTLKLLHHWPIIVAITVVFVGALLTGVITTEPYVVSMARRMFPNYEVVNHVKRGKWEAVIMYDPMTGSYLYVYFYDKKFQTTTTYKP